MADTVGKFTYGDISLDIIGLTCQKQKELSADGSTYECTKFILDIDCALNPSYESYRGGAVGAATPVFQVGLTPGQTEKALRAYFAQHRRQLTIDYHGRAGWLISPLTGYTVDARNGPQIDVETVVETWGIRTAIVRFRVITWLVEIVSKATMPVLLSHRWTQAMDTNEDYYSTITTDGDATFRVDELLRLGTYPDQYRHDLFHPIPNNHTRTISVTAKSDGTGVFYRLVDTEKAFNLTGTQATRIEAYQTVSFGRPSIVGAALSVTSGVIHGAAQAGQAGGAFAGPLVALGGAALHGAIALQRAMPKFSLSVLVKVWGHRNSTRASLMSYALGIANKRIQKNNAGRTYESLLTHVLNEKHVELSITQSWGPIGAVAAKIIRAAQAAGGNLVADVLGLPGGFVAAAMDPITADGMLNLFLPETDDRAQPGGFTQIVGAGNVPPVGGTQVPRRSRGSSLEAIVAQALSSAESTPPAPALTTFAASNLPRP